MTDWYQHDVQILVDAIDEVGNHKKALIEAKSDIERLAAMEKLIAYSVLLTQVASWAFAKIRNPESAK